jgi:hypothetical protein
MKIQTKTSKEYLLNMWESVEIMNEGWAAA